MKKMELIAAVAKETDMPKVQAGEAVAAVVETITKQLAGGKTVALTGFGAFSVVKRKARVGVNPRTGAKIQIPATKTPKFKAGKSLKDAVK